MRRGRPSARAVGALGHLDRVPLAFLYGKDGLDDHYTAEVGKSIEDGIATLAPEHRARFALRFLDAGPLTTFDGLVVAIPALFAYQIFRNKAMRISVDFAGILEDMTERFRNR